MGQRFHVRGVDRHHGVEEEGQVDALGLDHQLEVLAIALERPRTLGDRLADASFIGAVEETLL